MSYCAKRAPLEVVKGFGGSRPFVKAVGGVPSEAKPRSMAVNGLINGLVQVSARG